jgi:hypothetical protein
MQDPSGKRDNPSMEKIMKEFEFWQNTKMPKDMLDRLIELTNKYFGFLETDFNFVYDRYQNTYEGKTIKVIVGQYERLCPNILIWIKTEPPCTTINLDWLLEDQWDKKETDKYLLEDNFKFYSRWCRDFVNLPIEKIYHLLLKAVKNRLANGIKIQRCTKYDYQSYLTAFDKDVLLYINRKDPSWDLGNELSH